MLFHIKVPEVYEIMLHIEAASEDAAIEAAKAILNHERDLESTYSHTLERDSWKVWSEPTNG